MVYWLALGYRIFEILWRFTLKIFVGNEKGKIPPITNKLLLLPAITLADKIRTKQVKSSEVVKAYIQRIKEVNPLINAVIDDRFTDAIEDAIAADVYIERSGKTEEELAREKPFLGVPITTKNGISVKGLLADCSNPLRKGDRAPEDCVPIASMRKAGAIPLCISNVPELCFWTDASNTIYGRTKNPFDLTKNPGGSTGGESALISSGGSVFGLGNDIYGSVRSPSFNCCIYAHKPTTFVVSNEGEVPALTGYDLNQYFVTGPMCRYAADLLPTYKILAADNLSKLKLDTRVDIRKVKVYYTEDYSSGPFITPIHPEVKASVSKVVSHLSEAYGIKATKIKLPVPVSQFMPIWMSKYGLSNAPSLETLITKNGFNFPWEFLKWCLRISEHTIHILTFMACERFSSNIKDPKTVQRNLEAFDQLEQFFQDVLKDDGVFLYPTQPEPSYYHYEQFLKFYNNGYTGIFNLLGYPVTQCPTGLCKGGTPLGVQVVATQHNDHLTLAMANALDKGLCGWIDPANK